MRDPDHRNHATAWRLAGLKTQRGFERALRAALERGFDPLLAPLPTGESGVAQAVRWGSREALLAIDAACEIAAIGRGRPHVMAREILLTLASLLREGASWKALRQRVDLLAEVRVTPAWLDERASAHPVHIRRIDLSEAKTLFARVVASDDDWPRVRPLAELGFIRLGEPDGSWHPLARALRSGFARVTGELLALDPSAANKDLWPSDGGGPFRKGGRGLHLVKDAACAKLLLDAGAQVDARDGEERVPLHAARSVDLVRLLAAADAPLNALDAQGRTPLMAAVLDANEEVALALLSLGADVERRDAVGQSALDLATDGLFRGYWPAMTATRRAAAARIARAIEARVERGQLLVALGAPRQDAGAPASGAAGSGRRL